MSRKLSIKGQAESRVSVILASDFPILRDNIAKSFESSRELRVVATANSEDEVVRLAKVYRPKVAVLDLNIQWVALRDLVRTLRTGGVATLLISDDIDEAQTIELLQCGASGIIPRRTTSEMLHKCLCSVASGEIWISRQTFAELVEQVRAPLPRPANNPPVTLHSERTFVVWSKVRITNSRRASSHFNLTRRELQIVQAVVEGMTNKAIAASFGISEFTVKHHLAKIFDKVGVYNRLELATFARHHGLLSVDEPAETYSEIT